MILIHWDSTKTGMHKVFGALHNGVKETGRFRMLFTYDLSKAARHYATLRTIKNAN